MTHNEKMMSIIVPVYNVEKWLSQCIESIINQSYKNLEIILINDGSTDSSEEICNYYQQKDQRIRILNQQNEGPSKGRNNGIKHSIGEYIMFMDSDDFLSDQTIVSKFVEILETSQSDFIYTTYCRFNDGDSSQITEILPLNIEDDFVKSHNGIEILSQLIRCNSYHHAPYLKVCRRDFLINNQLYFTEGLYHEDAEWTAKVFYYAKKVSVYKQPYYMRRMRENSIMTSEDVKFIFRKLKDRMKIAQDLVEFFYKIEEQEAKEIIMNDFIRMYWGDLISLINLKSIDKEEKLKIVKSTFNILGLSSNQKYQIMYQSMKWIGIKPVLTLVSLKGAV